MSHGWIKWPHGGSNHRDGSLGLFPFGTKSATSSLSNVKKKSAFYNMYQDIMANSLNEDWLSYEG